MGCLNGINKFRIKNNLTIENHSMVGVGRDLCGSPSPTLCPRRVTHSRLHSTASRRGWNISREEDSTTSLGSLGQGSVTLRVKKFFLMFSWNFLGFSLCPLPLVLSLGTTGKSLAPSSWPPPCRYLVSKVPSQPSLLQAEQAQLPQPLLVGEMLQSPHHPRSPIISHILFNFAAVQASPIKKIELVKEWTGVCSQPFFQVGYCECTHGCTKRMPNPGLMQAQLFQMNLVEPWKSLQAGLQIKCLTELFLLGAWITEVHQALAK